MPTPILVPYGPFQPLGLITVTTPGTPIPIYQNIGSYYTATGASAYAMSFNQVWIRATAANTGAIYLVAPGGSLNNTGSIIWYLNPGEYIFIGADALSRNTYALGDFLIDGATTGNSCTVTGIVGG
jgi:hypothetical protein